MEYGNQDEATAVSVTVGSTDRDLAELLRYLSRYDGATQAGLLRRAEEWRRLTAIGGVVGATSARMVLCPADNTEALSGSLSELPE